MPENRNASPAVERLFVERWSPRAFDGSEIGDQELHILFDAARWAPSAYNVQPWRFLYARRADANWRHFLDLLLPMNRDWAQNASALLYILSDGLMEMKGKASPSHSHSFDAGAAWMLLALQARRMGFYTHAMQGLDFDRARAELRVPERFHIEAAVAVGRIADPETLPEALRARERASDRKPVADFAFAGIFPQN